MAKTVKELREELSNLLSGIMQTNSSFAIANLSQKILEVVKEWKEARELEEGQKSKPEPKPEPKDVEIELLGDIIISHWDTGHVFYTLRIREKDVPTKAVDMAIKLSAAITGVDYSRRYGDDEFTRFRDYLIQILEEKFGLTIKICGNCKNYVTTIARSFGHCKLDESEKGVDASAVEFGWKCVCKEQNWTPKKIPPEKKEEEKTCGNCGATTGDIACLSCYEKNHWIPKEIKE